MDKALWNNIHTVEQEFGVYIDGEYNFTKLMSQIDYLKKRSDEMKKAQKSKK